MAFEVCVCFVTRRNEVGTPQVLLGRKKTGLGAGNVVGPGGKLEQGETALEAIVREVHEESGLTLDPSDLVERGYLRYAFPYRESWSQNSTVFVTDSFIGLPRETDEIDPRWYDIDNLPLDDMWDDARYWLPGVLAGDSVHAKFTFGADLKTVSESEFDRG